MRKSGKDYAFSIEGSTKMSKKEKRKPDITFHRFSEDYSLCPKKTLEHYLKFSKTWRGKGDRNQLLHSHIESYMPVSTVIVARWVNRILGLDGIDISIFKAHSFRAASTSKAKFMGLSAKIILKRGNWSRESTWQKYIKHMVLFGKLLKESTTRGNALN